MSTEWLLLPSLALPCTRWALTDLRPVEWREASSVIRGMLAREPLKSAPAWAGVRILLGTLAAELDEMTTIVGDEPAEAANLYDRSGERDLSAYRANVEALERHGILLRGA